MADKLHYTINRSERAAGYDQLVIRVLPRLEMQDGRFRDQASMHFRLEFDWQRKAGSSEEWYGFSFTLEGDRIEDSMLGNATLHRLIGGMDRRKVTPRMIVEKLHRLRPAGERVIYDPRIYGYLPPDEVAPAQVHRFCDDYRAMGRDGVTVCDLIDYRADLEVKQDAVEAKLEKYVKSAWGRKAEDYLERWREAGRPVIDVSTASPFSEIPEWEDEEVLLG